MSKPIYKIWYTWFVLIIFLWSISFVAGFAFGQDCTYVNNIIHDKEGNIVKSSQEYVCKTPPKVVEIHTYPNKDAHNVMQTEVYGLSLNSYENPQQVLYNMNREIEMNRAIADNNLNMLSKISFFLSMFE